MPERRYDERSACSIASTLVLTDGRSLYCVVKNLSEGGAKIEVVDTASLPQAFDLIVPVLPGAGQTFRAALVWREGPFAGVEFKGMSGKLDQ